MRRRFVKSDLVYYYPNRQLPTLEPDEISSLVRLARDGDIEARNKLIEGKLKHALALASLVAANYPLKADDLAELAPYALVKCVDSFLRNGYDDGIDRYVTSYMIRSLNRLVFEDRIIRIPQQTAYRHTQNGMFDSLNISVLTQGNVNHTLVDILVMSLSPKVQTNLTVNMNSDLDVWESINNVLEDDEERRILELRIIGCTDKEVALDIKKSISYVAQKRTKILHSIKMELLK